MIQFTSSVTLRLLTACAILLTLSCARNPVTGKRQMSLMSTEQEIQLGASADPSVQAEYGMYEDTALGGFLNEKGQAMAKLSHRPTLPWTFKVVDSPVVNAFAVPGGKVYFTRGIMAHFNSEAQLAGVLGHEIGHVTARHGAEQYTKGTLAQLGLIVGMIASPQFAQFGEAASQGVQLLMLKNGRNDESQSDELGVQYSAKIGYDPKHMADFFQTLKRIGEKAGGGHELPTFMSTHPDPEDRYNKVRVHAERYKKLLGRRQPTFVENRDEYLRRIEGLVYGEDPKQGYVEAGRFYHPELKFSFPVPQGWKHQNMPTQFQMASADGNAMMVLSLSNQKTLQAAATEDAKQYSLVASDSRQTTINGLPALAVMADQVQQDQNTGKTANTGIKVATTFIQYNGAIYILRGVSNAQFFIQYRDTFGGVMKAFEPLSDPEKINRVPERIKIVTVPRNMSLADLLKEQGIPAARNDEFAILNGMQLKDMITSGMLVKVVNKVGTK
jgi:predicted Zn-dependent protease